MTNPIQTDYHVNTRTMALVPASHIDYHTIVLETHARQHVKHTPRQLVSMACLDNWSTYDGRRQAVIHQLNIRHKVPIPINPYHNLIAVPTSSPTDFPCIWLFYHHIQTILPSKATPTNPAQQSLVIFHNHEQLPLDVSYYTLQKQLERAGVCAGSLVTT